MIHLIAVAAGGALGSLLRHGVNQMATMAAVSGFPWATMVVNITGSFVMGLLAGAFAQFWDTPQALRLFLMTGLVGGFTTFSAFSLDSILLIQKGQTLLALCYIMGSVLLSLAGLFLGLVLMRMIPA